MSDLFVFRALHNRGIDLPDGTAYRLLYVHRRVTEDPPVYEAAKAQARRSVAAHVTDHAITADDVTLSEVTAAELVAAWREHAPMEPPPFGNVGAIVAHWTPPARLPRTTTKETAR